MWFEHNNFWRSSSRRPHNFLALRQAITESGHKMKITSTGRPQASDYQYLRHWKFGNHVTCQLLLLEVSQCCAKMQNRSVHLSKSGQAAHSRQLQPPENRATISRLAVCRPFLTTSSNIKSASLCSACAQLFFVYSHYSLLSQSTFGWYLAQGSQSRHRHLRGHHSTWQLVLCIVLWANRRREAALWLLLTYHMPSCHWPSKPYFQK